MSDTHGTHAPDQHDPSHATADAHDIGHDDSHGGGHGGNALGPIDWTMWGVGVLGVVAALIIAAGFVIATSFSFTA
jgi:hypothetical protein